MNTLAVGHSAFTTGHGRWFLSDERAYNNKHQHQENDTPRQVASVRRKPPHDPRKHPEESCGNRALPQRMQQSPAQFVNEGTDEKHRKRVHFPSPSNRSNNLRIPPKSAAVAFFFSSACMTSLPADPENTCSSRCPTTCRC